MRKKFFLLIIVCLVMGAGVMAQTSTVSGTVFAEDNNEPIIGASVLVKGTTLGAVTDIEGKFTILNVPGTAKTVIVSFVGMQKVEAAIKPAMKVVLKSDSELLDEVMVVAYGTAKKSSYAGSASLVKADALKDIPTTSFENALNGKVAGLQLTNNSGQAGSAPAIRIRGIGSMNAGNEPLYVVDGVPVSSGNTGQMSGELYSTNNIMNTLNPEDIESISVLKDAAASSLYGSRAANGVILITTKKGQIGKPVVTLKAEVGFTPCWATDNYETASVQENVNMLYTVFHDARTSGKGETDEKAAAYAIGQLNSRFNKHGYQFTTNGTGAYENVNILEYDNSGRGGKYYDWDKAYFRTAIYQTYDMSVSGATQNTNYYTSLSYTQDEGRLKMNSFDRVSGRLNLTQKVGKFLELTTNASLARTKKSGYNDTRNTGSNYFMQTRNLLWGLYWPTDYKTGELWTERYGSYAYNGLYYDKEWENGSTSTKIIAAETLTLHLMPGLDLRSIYSYDNTTVKDHIYYSANHYKGSADNGNVNEYRTTYEKMVTSTTANYTGTFDKHTVGTMVGFEAEKNKTDYVRATGSNLAVSTIHTVSTAGTQTSAGYSWGNSMVSVLSKLDYNYDERYFISGSYRRDGSSRLSKQERWGNFWSVAGAWNIMREGFMSKYSFLSNLRIRASYGINGTLPSDNYGYMSLMSYTSKYMGNPGGTITTVTNDKLSWETSYNTNVGIDFGFFGQRLRGTVEYFNRDSKNLLQDVPISMVTGFSSTLRNVGCINNHGVEVELSGDIIDSKGWLWSAGVNATFLRSEVKELYGGANIIWYDPTSSDSRAQYVYREGQSTLAFYGYEWAGVDKTNGKNVYYVNDPKNGKAGDFEYNGRGATYDYNNANYTIIGNAVPKVYGGINTSVSYKGIALSLGFTYKIGGDLYDGAYMDVADDGYYWERIRAKSYYNNLWTPDHTNGTEPRIEGVDLDDPQQYSSRHLFNASYLRLKNLSLAYTLPKAMTRKAFIENARLFFTASNLWTIAKYKEADPEVSEYGTRGWETPIGKTFVVGVELKF
jgi:TonB-linked SusC/RagA family outer membrane protein